MNTEERRYMSWVRAGREILEGFREIKNRLIFPEVIEKSHQGKYVLRLYETSKPEGESTMIWFEIIILSAPEFENYSKLPRTISHIKGIPLEVPAIYSGEEVTMNIEINGMKIDLLSKE